MLRMLLPDAITNKPLIIFIISHHGLIVVLDVFYCLVRLMGTVINPPAFQGAFTPVA